MRLPTNGFVLMALAAVFYSMSDVLLKLLSAFPAGEIGFIRFVTGGLILWPFMVSKGIALRGHGTGALLLRGAFGTVSFFLLQRSITLIPLSNAMVLFYTYPLFVVLLSFFLLGERLEKSKIGLIVMGLLGICVFVNPGTSPSFGLGYVFGLLASGFGAVAMVMIRKARASNGPLIIYFYFCLVGGLLSIPLMFYGFRIPGLKETLLLVLLALLILGGQLLMNQGFKDCKAAEGALLLMMEVVFAGIAGVLVFQDPVTPRFLAGSSLIVGSGVGLNLIAWRARRG
jgi:drug/metabolite transporter (DMT)-like permease